MAPGEAGLSKPNQTRSIRNILLCVVVFFLGVIFLEIIFGTVSAVLLYLLLQSRDRVQALERSTVRRQAAPGFPEPNEVPSSSEP